MKTVKVLALGVLAVVAMSFTNSLNNGNHAVSSADSKVVWVGKKVTGQHTGTIAIKSGAIEVKDGELVGGEFTIDMATLTSTDLEGEYLGKLNGHLKSDDFFGVATFPEANFKITKVEAKGSNGRYSVTGNMTIKSTTKAVTFDAQLVNNGDKLVAMADIVIDRSEYDIRYGSGSFFDNLGDKTIYDDFTLSVSLATE